MEDNLNIKSAGVKYDQEKEMFDLVAPGFLFELVRVLTYGAKKYDNRNWESGMRWGRVFAALMRHLWKWWAGERYDQESGVHHLAAAAFGCMVLFTYETSNDPKLLAFDDRSRIGAITENFMKEYLEK